MNWFKKAVYNQPNSRFYQALFNARSQFAAAAQKVYNEWDQSGEEGDPDLGFGGICQNIAAEISNVVSSLGFNSGTMEAQCGDQHVWCIAYNEEQGLFGTQYEGYHIDIKPSVYESGGGYLWTKKEGTVFDANHVNIIPMDEEEITGYLEYT